MAEPPKPRQPRRALTADEKADAVRLKAEWQAYKAANRGCTQEWLGRESGIGAQQAVEQYLNARVPLNVEALIAFSRALSVPVEKISPKRFAELTGHRSAAMHEAGSAGILGAIAVKAPSAPPPVPQAVSATSALDVRLFLVPTLTDAGDVAMPQPVALALHAFGGELEQRADHLACMKLRADDDAMAPTLYPGDLLLVDTHEGLRGDLAAHALHLNGTLCVRRVAQLPDGSYHLTADNPTVKPEIAQADAVHLLGRVVLRMGTAFLLP